MGGMVVAVGGRGAERMEAKDLAAKRILLDDGGGEHYRDII